MFCTTVLFQVQRAGQDLSNEYSAAKKGLQNIILDRAERMSAAEQAQGGNSPLFKLRPLNVRAC
jgi:hypothetical protein